MSQKEIHVPSATIATPERQINISDQLYLFLWSSLVAEKLFVAGSTGQGDGRHLTPDHLGTLVEVALHASQIAGRNNSNDPDYLGVTAGVFGLTDKALIYADTAVRAGAWGLVIPSPYTLWKPDSQSTIQPPTTQDAMDNAALDHILKIGRAYPDIQIFPYNMPKTTPGEFNFSPELIEAFRQNIPNLGAVKDSSRNTEITKAFADITPTLLGFFATIGGLGPSKNGNEPIGFVPFEGSILRGPLLAAKLAAEKQDWAQVELIQTHGYALVRSLVGNAQGENFPGLVHAPGILLEGRGIGIFHPLSPDVQLQPPELLARAKQAYAKVGGGNLGKEAEYLRAIGIKEEYIQGAQQIIETRFKKVNSSYSRRQDLI